MSTGCFYLPIDNILEDYKECAVPGQIYKAVALLADPHIDPVPSAIKESLGIHSTFSLLYFGELKTYFHS